MDTLLQPGAAAPPRRAEPLEHNKLIKRLRRQMGQAIQDYAMISEGDRVMVCLSGGKDSYTMLDVLLRLQESAPVSFELVAVNLDQKQPDFPEHVLPGYLKSRGVPFHILEQDTYSVVKRVIPEGKTMCSLCSRLRRGALYTYAEANGFNKIALGHHRDDILATFFLNLFFGGKLKAMPPKLKSDNGKHIVIRPLAYVREEDTLAYAEQMGFPIIPCNLCGSQEQLQRKQVRRMMDEWERQHPGRAETIFRALQNVAPSQLADPRLFDFAALDGALARPDWLMASPGGRGMKSCFARLALGGSLLLGLSCAAALADTDAPFAWEVKGPKATHYLVGSVHLLPQSENDLPKGLEDIYDTAEGLMFETDIGALEQQQVQIPFLQAAHTEKGLKSMVSAPLHAKLLRRLRKLGVDTSVCEPFKPWFCSLALEILTYRDAGFSGEDGIDEKFYKSAISDGKSVRWFESPADHLGLFADMSDAMSLRLLESALDDTATQLDEPKQVYKTWRQDDFAVIETVTAQLKTEYPDLYERLLAERNRNWMPKLKQALDGAEIQLIVVGAAHLAGPDGLVARLSATGYRLQRYVSLPGEQIQARQPEQDLIRVRDTARR